MVGKKILIVLFFVLSTVWADSRAAGRGLGPVLRNEFENFKLDPQKRNLIAIYDIRLIELIRQITEDEIQPFLRLHALELGLDLGMQRPHVLNQLTRLGFEFDEDMNLIKTPQEVADFKKGIKLLNPVKERVREKYGRRVFKSIESLANLIETHARLRNEATEAFKLAQNYFTPVDHLNFVDGKFVAKRVFQNKSTSSPLQLYNGKEFPLSLMNNREGYLTLDRFFDLIIANDKLIQIQSACQRALE